MFSCKPGHAPPVICGQDDGTGFRAGLYFFELVGEGVDGFFPGDVCKLARPSLTGSFFRRVETIGVVMNLQAGLATCTQGPAVHWVERVALDLVRLVFPGSDEDSTTGGAGSAGRGLPIIKAGHVLIIRNKGGNKLVLGMSTCRQERRRCRTCRGEYDEFSSLHQFLSIQG